MMLQSRHSDLSILPMIGTDMSMWWNLASRPKGKSAGEVGTGRQGRVLSWYIDKHAEKHTLICGWVLLHGRLTLGAVAALLAPWGELAGNKTDIPWMAEQKGGKNLGPCWCSWTSKLTNPETALLLDSCLCKIINILIVQVCAVP